MKYLGREKHKSKLLAFLFLIFSFCSDYSYSFEEDLLKLYSQQYCQANQGRTNFPIQNKIYVDCLTSEALWKLGFAKDWSEILTSAMFFPIYDDYRGEQKYKPKSGVVLVKQTPQDYKYLVKLKQIIDHYQLPVKIDSIDRYQENQESVNSSGPQEKNTYFQDLINREEEQTQINDVNLRLKRLKIF